MITSQRTKRAAIAAFGLLAATGTAFPALSAAAAPTLTCGTTVTRDIRLTADLTGCAGTALVVGAAGVTIDLAGHAITGNGKGAGINNTAGHHSLVVRNGTISGFKFGVEVLGGDGVRIDRLAVTGNADGLNVSRTSRLDVTRVDAGRNSSSGISITFGDRSSVRWSRIAGNGLFGIADRFGAESRHEGNLIVGNLGTGLVLDRTEGAAVLRNTTGANGNHGVELVSVEGGAVRENRSVGNAGDGIAVDEAGSKLSRNLANGNAGFGIRAARGTLDGGRNTARGNLEGACEGVVCR